MVTLLCFWFREQPKTLNFLPLKDTLLGTFIETRASTSRKHASEQGIVMSNWSKTFQNFRSHSFVFPLEKQPTNLNFQSLFSSNRPFGDYFQWKDCAYFQKICNSARYSDAKLIKNISKVLVVLLRFSFRKEPKNLNFHIFLALIVSLLATFNEWRTPTSRKYVSEQGIVIPNWSKIF